MFHNHRIAVVIPAYRVAKKIGSVLEVMPGFVDDVFVVDDASPDAAGEQVSARGEVRVRVLRHETNQGVGGATVSGIRAALEAGSEIVVKCDGDGQMNPGDIHRLLRPIVEGRADHVKASRLRHLEALRTMPRMRLIGNIGLTFLSKVATGYWNVVDPVNGFVATSAETLRRLPLERLSKRYFFETDLLARLNEVEARVEEVPLPARYGDESSSLSTWKELFRFPPRLLLCLLRRVFWRYLFYDVSPVAVFGIIGTGFLGFGVAFGLTEWAKHAMAGKTTPLGTIMLAAVPTILGFQALLQALAWDIQFTPRPGRRGRAGDTDGVGRESDSER